MDTFESQFADLDVATGYYENATSNATAMVTPQEDVDRLMGQVADEAGLEMKQDLPAAVVKQKMGPTEQEENTYVLFPLPIPRLVFLFLSFDSFDTDNLCIFIRLNERLRALRS
jgi:hypothetical protein